MDLRNENINIPQKLRSLSYHNFIGLCSVFLLVLIDSFFLGLKGEDQLAAAVFASPLIFFFVNIFMGIANAKMVFVSKNISIDREKLNRNSNLIDLIVLSTYLFALIFLLFNTSNIINLFAVEEEIIPLVKDYMIIHYVTAFFCVYNTLCSAYIRGLGDSRLPARIMSISALFNLVLDPIFIFYFDWGARGAALATGMAWMFSSIYMTYHLRVLQKITFKLEKFDLKSFGLTLPSFVVSQILNPITILLVFYVIAEYGTSVLSGIGLGIRFDKFIVIMGFAFGGALSVFVGQNIENNNRCLDGYKSALSQTIVLSLCMSIILYLIAPLLGALFNLSKETLHALELFFVYNVPTTVLNAIYVINSSYFNVSNQHNVVLKSNIIKTLISLPLLLFIFVDIYGWHGALIGMFLNNVVSNIVLLLCAKKETRRKMTMVLMTK